MPKSTMETPGFIKNLQQSIDDPQHWLTRRKLAAFGVTLIVAGGVIGGFERSRSEPAIQAPTVVDLPVPDRSTGTHPLDDAPPGPVPEAIAWEPVKVRSGQTLDGIFREQGFSIARLHDILALNGETQGLTRIRPGDVFEFERTDSGELKKMRYALDEARFLLVHNNAGQLSAELQQRDISAETTTAEGVIDSSLFLAGKQAGLSDAMIMNLANIFGWDIDFVLDIREGDRFMLVYEKLYRDGEYLREGRILAATFVNQGEPYRAVWFEEGEVADYFAPDGRNMRKAFLRAPLNFRYISSNFNPRRMHPVLKRVRPHRGIDYKAPRGTPVYAAGDGTVIRSAYSKANGHHVFVKHANSIVTKYLHFTKRTVKKGQKVKQGQTIGTVGSTGMASGAHLHYEFVVNGVHRNPRTVPLPKVQPLKGELLAAFRAKSAPLLTQLSRMESASLYARRD
ncbi:MAG: peptidoglycan DD-metalloendopeptidase family protein [Xanthomonadales bacterium]|nr:peptidoglycan DD-metalloendopeptidase family protein [Gammaproteobacteria bacterium]MBT8057161.1 peptidoglycan DD-metalloendopeptidase family protein [Gammaproteobacteria bacterium]NNL04014.1 peptidoglycan DD-metalloendopeptidase family protein [Xanthomonadales bacterium]